MLKTILSASALSLALLSGAASAATVTVDSKANSTTGGTGLATGVLLTVGQLFSVTASATDTWSLGGNDAECNREGNADGLTDCDQYNPYVSPSGLTAPYGTLVGQIGGGDFFVIGTNFRDKAVAAGELFLFNFDSYEGDNTGSIVATVAVPLPAGGLLLLGALGGIAALRRRKAV